MADPCRIALRASQIERLKDLFALRRAGAIGRKEIAQLARLYKAEWDAFKKQERPS